MPFNYIRCQIFGLKKGSKVFTLLKVLPGSVLLWKHYRRNAHDEMEETADIFMAHSAYEIWSAAVKEP